MLFLLVSAFGCADIIGLNGLDDEGDDAASGGGANDEETGGSSAGGSSEQSGGEAGDGDGDGGTAGDGDGGEAGDGDGGTGGGADGGGGQPNGNGGSDSTGGTLGSGGTVTIDLACADDMLTNEGTTEDCWSVVNAQDLSGGDAERGYAFEPGLLTMQPEQGTGWRNGQAGFLMYQEIPGDFVVEVQANFEDDNTVAIEEVYGGLLVVPGDPSATPQTDYFAIKFGRLAAPNGDGFSGEYAADDVGTTIALPHATSISGDGVYVRACRVGANLWLGAKRGNDAAWTPLTGNGDLYYETGEDGLVALGESVKVGLIAEMFGPGQNGSTRILYRDTQIIWDDPEIPYDDEYQHPPTTVNDCGDSWFGE